MAYADTRIDSPDAGLTGAVAAGELYRVGLIYANGMGVAVDYVAAHKWFNLAAARGHSEAKNCRQEMADMMTSAEIAKALRAAREWPRKAS